MDQIEKIEKNIAPSREALRKHRVYSELKDIHDVRLFMEQHVFAVWDFMSLLKALQQELTCTTVPWMPKADAKVAHFINEIVLGEESDVNEIGEYRSHFEMYLDAMGEMGADKAFINAFISNLRTGTSVQDALMKLNLPETTRKFVEFTFKLIDRKRPHEIASAFTFGREDLIPDMFLAIIDRSGQEGVTAYPKLKYYLERHIEVDGDDHGPLALKMIEQLCGADEQKWKEAEMVAIEALHHRIALWNGVADLILTREAKTRLHH